MLKGFRDFVLRGNVIDLAVAVVMGAAFSGVVKAITENFITPLIALVGGAPDTSALNVAGFGWGNILSAVLNFLITAAVVYFLIVAPLNRLVAQLKPAPPPQATKKCAECLSDIPADARRCAFCTSASGVTRA